MQRSQWEFVYIFFFCIWNKKSTYQCKKLPSFYLSPNIQLESVAHFHRELFESCSSYYWTAHQTEIVNSILRIPCFFPKQFFFFFLLIALYDIQFLLLLLLLYTCFSDKLNATIFKNITENVKQQTKFNINLSIFLWWIIALIT